MVLLLLAHAAATLFMVGIIWFVQVVHYPLFARVGAAGFAAYSATHARLTGLVVGPPMLVEAATAIALVVSTPPKVSSWLLWVGLVLLAGIWLSTALLQSPSHTELGRGFDLSAHRSLVGSNWVRTVLWSLRGLIVLWILSEAMG
ncbi:MAG TPA: hypothetical protein VF206_04945 [Rubrobacter sp.]|jgi:hypothetical protein